MITRTGTENDIILVTAEYYDDHPLSPAGVIARVLDAEGYSIGIIEKPESAEDIARLGPPRLFFGVTSGSIDSMVHNYTPMKRKRIRDEHNRIGQIPDRAVIVYCNLIKRKYKGIPMVLGGVEASLRRFAHYDYWDNKLRRSILLDSRADILVYGNGEKQIVEIASRLSGAASLDGIEGTCILRKDPGSAEKLPSFREVSGDPEKFCEMTARLTNDRDLAQEYNNNYVVQYRYPQYTTEDLDRIYSLPFTRKLHPESGLKMARFSVVTHRGCIGNCNFCALRLLQGDRIISRSRESILREIEGLASHHGFRGIIDDLGGPSANMYGMDCRRGFDRGGDTGCDMGGVTGHDTGSEKICRDDCMDCRNLNLDHDKLIRLQREARAVPGVKKIFVRSGIRYDLALRSREYVRELVDHHVSGTLKIAPEHFSGPVLALMNKDNSRFDDFVGLWDELSTGKRMSLRYYFMIGHPGDDMEEMRHLVERAREFGNVEQFQLFTPTPMTPSTCMYWTGMHPETKEKVKVVYDYGTKKKMKRMMLEVLKGGVNCPSPYQY